MLYVCIGLAAFVIGLATGYAFAFAFALRLISDWRATNERIKAANRELEARNANGCRRPTVGPKGGTGTPPHPAPRAGGRSFALDRTDAAFPVPSPGVD